VNRTRSIWLTSILLIGVAMIVVSGCSSETETVEEDLESYRGRIGPAYEDARNAQFEFETSVQQNLDIDMTVTSAEDSVENVLDSAALFQGSAGILISILRSQTPPDRCAIYNSVLIGLMEAYSSEADLVVEEMELLSGGTAGSLESREAEGDRLVEEIALYISVFPKAEIDCFVVEEPPVS
jgi:hypothetical protein